MYQRSLRIGIIGTNWGRMHIGGFRGAGATVVALCGRDQAETAAIAHAEGIPVATNRVAELCANVELVVVASPDAVHREHIELALDAGCHVLTEKPITRAADDARALVARAQSLYASEGRICAVSFPYRMSPPVVALATWLGAQGTADEDGKPNARAPGEWLTVTLRSSFAAAEGRASEGPLMGGSGDFGGASHILDTAFWLLRSRPAWVEAVMMGRPAHSLSMHIGLESGAVVAVNHIASHDPGIVGQWDLLGPDWEARFSGEYRPSANGWRIGPTEGYESTGADGAWWRQIGASVAPGSNGEPWALAHCETAGLVQDMCANPDAFATSRLAGFHHGADVQATFEAAMRSEQEGCRVLVRKHDTA